MIHTGKRLACYVGIGLFIALVPMTASAQKSEVPASAVDVNDVGSGHAYESFVMCICDLLDPPPFLADCHLAAATEVGIKWAKGLRTPFSAKKGSLVIAPTTSKPFAQGSKKTGAEVGHDHPAVALKGCGTVVLNPDSPDWNNVYKKKWFLDEEFDHKDKLTEEPGQVLGAGFGPAGGNDAGFVAYVEVAGQTLAWSGDGTPGTGLAGRKGPIPYGHSYIQWIKAATGLASYLKITLELLCTEIAKDEIARPPHVPKSPARKMMDKCKLAGEEALDAMLAELATHDAANGTDAKKRACP